MSTQFWTQEFRLEMKYENEDAKVTAACISSADVLESWKYTTWKIKL